MPIFITPFKIDASCAAFCGSSNLSRYSSLIKRTQFVCYRIVISNKICARTFGCTNLLLSNSCYQLHYYLYFLLLHFLSPALEVMTYLTSIAIYVCPLFKSDIYGCLICKHYLVSISSIIVATAGSLRRQHKYLNKLMCIYISNYR